MFIANHLPKVRPPLPIRWGLEPLGKWRKEFAVGKGPLRAERAGASESLGRGEGFLRPVHGELPRLSTGSEPMNRWKAAMFSLLLLKSRRDDLKIAQGKAPALHSAFDEGGSLRAPPWERKTFPKSYSPSALPKGICPWQRPAAGRASGRERVAGLGKGGRLLASVSSEAQEPAHPLVGPAWAYHFTQSSLSPRYFLYRSLASIAHSSIPKSFTKCASSRYCPSRSPSCSVTNFLTRDATWPRVQAMASDVTAKGTRSRIREYRAGMCEQNGRVNRMAANATTAVQAAAAAQ